MVNLPLHDECKIAEQAYVTQFTHKRPEFSSEFFSFRYIA